jgi:hypothetical protein
VFVLPNGGGLSHVLTINLGKLVSGSALVNGFTQPLSSLPLIQAAIQHQNQQLANGEAEDTGTTPEDTKDGSSKKLKPVDIGSYQTAIPPALNSSQLSPSNPSSPPASTLPGGGRVIIVVAGQPPG